MMRIGAVYVRRKKKYIGGRSVRASLIGAGLILIGGLLIGAADQLARMLMGADGGTCS